MKITIETESFIKYDNEFKEYDYKFILFNFRIDSDIHYDRRTINLKLTLLNLTIYIDYEKLV